ncbi:hypothetical protein GNI_211210 [Gregarina niphandrodes]|uniref:Uncharacterized protein n=1 Tax=Gregarina niphandrodes TaxID=110365 RepID=A0A023AW06_GRENI|nr:hypothetical protein GNI_211210 [Gregarina niphandrodes]EZG42894.1 hypothetical protein GNI_211210 [Gregarina niphandrodes]|eukprot:XP_011134689.1 hypothetical protein GNI_211210 [Gregarina niphandrodes]
MAPAPTGQLLRIGSLEEPDLLDGEGIQAGRTVKGYPSHSRLDAPLATVYSCLEKHWNRTSGQVHQLRDVRLTEPAVAYCIQEETEVMRESIMGLLKMMKPHWKLLTAMVSNRYSRRQREAADEAIIVRYPGIFDRAATMEDGLQDGSEKIEPVVRANTAWER